ncbi:MAG: cell surface protein SprA, partial [Chitinivibrionales bacterium]|nr:cell surface protein SprA [Chitinivibrionales bacterium]
MGNRANVQGLWAAMVVLAVGALRVSADQGLRLESPYLQRYHSPLVRQPYSNPFQNDTAAILEVNTKLFTDDEDIDFAKRKATFSKKDALGYEFWVHHYGELGDYLFGSMRYSLYDGWYRDVATADRSKETRRTPSALDFALPIQYPKWAQRILGKEPPKLSLDGYLKLIISYDNTRQEPETELSTESSGFQFDQESRFTIRGSIGRVIDISITAGSEEELEWENQLKKFKIEYKGEGDELEDEIIQEITAGYTDFQMPGQGLAGYSESHEGLFGIKIRSKLGPLMLTTIVSHEQGEAQELNVTRGGGSTSGQTVLNESDFVRYKFFFLDTAYLRHWVEVNAPGGQVSGPVPKVTGIDLWVSVTQAELTGRSDDDVYRYAELSNGERQIFRQLDRGVDYIVEEDPGWIRLDSVTLKEEDLLAMYLRTEDPILVPDKGDTTVIDSLEKFELMRSLVLLKDANPSPEQPSFPLSWRNVYRMPVDPMPSEFKVTVKHYKVGGDTVEHFDGKLISYLLGLTDDKGKVSLGNPPYKHKDIGYLVLPPFLDTREDSVIGNQPFRNPVLGDSTVADIYTRNRADLADQRDDYTIIMPGSSGGTGNEDEDKITGLGWGVMENSEKVVADGVELQRNRDYIIDYAMGTIELVTLRAKAAKNIRVTYQREALFVPEEKVFMGAHGRIDLPFLGKNTFAGASIMWQDASSSEKIPRIGQEPYSRFLLDFNTSMDFEPEWMTKAFSWFMPGVRPDEQSSLSFDFEVAHSRTNPNTDGEAFVDDFEASAQIFTLNQSERNWNQASPPAYLVDDTTVARGSDTISISRLLFHPPVWQSYWFQPLDNDPNSLKRSQIFNTAGMSDQEKNTREHILRLHCTPAPADSALRRNFVKPWAGIMTNIPGSFADRSEDKYLELYVRNQGGGVLHIDFGVIGEDLCRSGGPPNGDPDTEDSTLLYEPNAATDLGLDMLADESEFYLIPDLDSLKWDTLRYGNASLLRPEDPAGDNWKKYSTDKLDNREWVNGLQGNGGVPDAEDINLDTRTVSTSKERYFRATVDFEALSALMERYNWDVSSVPRDSLARHYVAQDGNVLASSKWVKLRIPLADSTIESVSAGGTAPSLGKIEAVRLFWTDFDSSKYHTEQQMLFTGIQFVGNQWQELPTLTADSSEGEIKIEASAVNNKDDQGYLDSTENARDRGLDLYWDRTTDGGWKREQALELTHWGLYPGEVALAERVYTYRTFNLSNYRSLSMLVHSSHDLNAEGIRFVFRFGGDSATYYEYRTAPLEKGWFGNEVDITLKDFSELKLEYLNNHPEDSLGIVDTVSADGHFRLHAAAGRMPSFSSIAWMAVGVMRDPGGLAIASDTAVLWVNEMKVTGIRELNGWALRTSLSTRWADFMDFSLSAEYTDADFRTMTEQLFKESNSVLKGAMDVTWRLDKFMPDDWGVSLPLGTTVSGSISRPLKKPNTDVDLTNNGEPDRLDDMFVDALRAITGSADKQGPTEKTDAERYQRTQVSRSWYTSYEKASKSDKVITQLTAERIKADYRYRYDLGTEGKGERPDGDDFIDT